MTTDELNAAKEPPEEFVIFPPVSDEQRKKLYDLFDSTIDKFLEDDEE